MHKFTKALAAIGLAAPLVSLRLCHNQLWRKILNWVFW